MCDVYINKHTLSNLIQLKRSSFVLTYFFSDDTGIRIDAPGNNTPSINNNGKRRGNLIFEVAIIEAKITPSIDAKRSIISVPQALRLPARMRETETETEKAAAGYRDSERMKIKNKSASGGKVTLFFKRICAIYCTYFSRHGNTNGYTLLFTLKPKFTEEIKRLTCFLLRFENHSWQLIKSLIFKVKKEWSSVLCLEGCYFNAEI